jgi:hypothetical protein
VLSTTWIETEAADIQIVGPTLFELKQEKKAPSFSLIIPVYNEADIIVEKLNVLSRYLERESCELIVFDDCSKDKTYSRLKEVLVTNPNMLLMHSTSRLGKGGTIKNAVRKASAGTVIIMDVDLSADLGSIPELMREANESGGIVVAERSTSDRYSQGFLRVMLSLAYNTLVRLLFRTGVRDHQCGFKAMRTDVARRLTATIRNNEFVFDTELIVLARKLGIPIKRIPVKWRDDRPKKSNLKWIRNGVTMMKDLIMIKINDRTKVY